MIVGITIERELSLQDLLINSLLNSVYSYNLMITPVYCTTEVVVPTYTQRAKKVSSPYLPDYGCVIYRSK